nr:zinc finger BED domain-containing protein RICESLEEPER 2-like [Ipomoea batatas]GMD99278.1 zinc finger BED domain-containing protein RICESLEEPER 2-like [Ipomoea batatas]
MEGGDITNKNVEIEDLYDCIEVVEVEEEQKDPQKSMKRKRKLRSQVWDHFDRLITKNTNGETIVKAKCKYCEVLINSDSKYGTGNLKRHTINCVRKNTRDIGQMLIGESALYFRMAFSHLEISDSNYKHCPSKDEWDRIEKLSKFLGVFYEITCVFSGTKYPTANLYFPAIFKARLTLEEQKNGDDLCMRNMAVQMFAKFEKYWSAFSLILAIAVILDPRYKIHFVDWSYKRLYGHDSMEFKKVKESLFSLYNEYADKISPRHVSSDYMNLGNDSVGTGSNDDDFEVIFFM